MLGGHLALEPGTIVAERFRVERILGRGGMGAVYEALHTVTLRRGALKILHSELSQSTDVVARFLREASAAGRIGSPHIVETIDAGRCEGGEPYIFMELLHGSPLETLIVEGGPLPLALAVDYVRQACRGLAAAHDAGIVHRDIKPENLFLVEGEKAFVKLLDFGISKFDPALTAVRALTIEGSALGTPFYMSPEQVQGRSDIDGRTDIYSLGVTLYRLLTARYPFFADTLPAIAVLIHKGEYPPASTFCKLPQGFDAVLGRAMAKETSQRFSTIREFELALARFEGTAPLPRVLETAPGASRGTTGSSGSTPPFAAATGAPFSQTLSSPRKRRGRMILGIAVGCGALGVTGLLLRERQPIEPEAASSAELASAPGVAAATPKQSPVAPKVTPSDSISASSASPSATAAGGAPSIARHAPKRSGAAAVGSATPGLKSGRLGSEFTRSYE